MQESIKRKWRPRFALTSLKNLPPELQSEGQKIWIVYDAFERLVCGYQVQMGIKPFASYRDFLKESLFESTAEAFQFLQVLSEDQEGDDKLRWYFKSEHHIFETIAQGHEKIDAAYLFLKRGEIANYAGALAEAGVHFGELKMICSLINEGVYYLIGSIKSAITGAALGGVKSGVTRRRQARVPSPEALRTARQKLIEAGKPPRQISAMLARKYDCTTDHIRKVLKRD